MLNKVPEVTLYFWVIKILCTTVGETASDFLSSNLSLGLTKTTFIVGTILAVVLIVQFRLRRYVPSIYWLAVVLISVVGTQITDNLTGNFGVTLATTTILFSIALAVVFAMWFAVEKTLSIHSIFTTRREGFYWLAILFTFALGTSAGDLAAESLKLGYLVSALIFGGLIVLITLSHYAARSYLSLKHEQQTSNAVLAFWLAYILTRPLGASIGDYLSQAKGDGGIGLGTTTTSAIFLSVILALVMYLAISKGDQTPPGAA